jgi:hypothetical protein
MEDQYSGSDQQLQLDPEFGKEVPVNETTNKFLEEYNKATSDNKLAAYRCGIVSGDRCGPASLGVSSILVNSDNSRSYVVTVRTQWQNGTQTGEFDTVVQIAAGSRSYLGCGLGPNLGQSRYFQIVGEQSINVVTSEQFKMIEDAAERAKASGGGNVCCAVKDSASSPTSYHWVNETDCASVGGTVVSNSNCGR